MFVNWKQNWYEKKHLYFLYLYCIIQNHHFWYAEWPYYLIVSHWTGTLYPVESTGHSIHAQLSIFCNLQSRDLILVTIILFPRLRCSDCLNARVIVRCKSREDAIPTLCIGIRIFKMPQVQSRWASGYISHVILSLARCQCRRPRRAHLLYVPNALPLTYLTSDFLGQDYQYWGSTYRRSTLKSMVTTTIVAARFRGKTAAV